MSGHSKWSQIKHKKGTADQKKGVLFGKLAKAISVVARNNPDPSTNLRLRSAIEQARSFDMPNENIDRLLKRASDKNQSELYELIIEAFGPAGVGIIITAVTDNKNRTIGDIKTILSKNGAHLSGQGSVLWMFRKDGSDYVANSSIPVDEKTQKQLSTLFEMLSDNEDVQEIFSNNENAAQ